MKKTTKKISANAGQALVVLVIFVTVATMVILASTLLSVYSTKSASASEQTEIALDVAESGMENAILRLLRDPSYVGETLTLTGGSATITVTGAATKTITSVGTAGNFKRTVVVTAATINGILTVTSWTDSF